MKVYTCRYTSAYCLCGGLIVVAANSEEEAYNIAKNSHQCRHCYYATDEGYLLENFNLLPKVVANVDTPQVLDEDCFEK